MARARRSDPLYIGIGSHVVAIDQQSGEEIWRTKIKRASYMTIYRDGDRLYAGASGELFCIDRNSGALLWHNKLKGLGLGFVAFAGSGDAAMAASAAAATTAATAAAV